MIVDTAAYVWSMIQVFASATILLVLFPLFMWRHYLREKDYAYRFVFAIVTQNCFLINLVLLLGFFGICNRYTVLAGIALLYLIISRQYTRGKMHKRIKGWVEDAKALAEGTKKPVTLWRRYKMNTAQWWRNIRRWPIWKKLLGDWPLYLSLLAAVVYTSWFMAHNVLIYHSVQFSDIPVHQSWIYALDHGTLFVDGIYPFGMHAIVYLIHNLFFLDLREVLLYFGAFQSVVLLLCVYLLARRVLRWKYSALIPVIAFALLLNQGRYAASLPQETGMFAVVLSGYFLLGIFQTPFKKHVVPKDGFIKRFFRINQYFNRHYLTNDVLLLMLSVSLCIAYHFYAAIAMAILVVAIVLTYFYRMVRKQYWVPIVLAGVLGVVIAITPFAACLAKGIPFQESIDWALSVMNGETWAGSESDYQTELESALSGETGTGDTQAEETVVAETAAEETQTPKVQRSAKEILLTVYRAMRDFSSSTMYSGVLTKLLMLCMGAGFGLGALFLLFKKLRLTGFNYAAMSLYMVLICIVGAAQALGIPEVLAASRASTFAEPFIGILYAVPFDFLLGIISLKISRRAYISLATISMMACGAAAGALFHFDLVHNFFDVNLAYYNEPVYLIQNIRKEFEKETYTVIATSDEYYQMLDYGFHENLSKFMDMVDGNEAEYKIPTKYVFFFIEKKVLQDYYYGSVYVDRKYTTMSYRYMANSQDYYYQRAVIESKAYYWAKRFMEIYPNSCQVYYEDDIYICYLVTQNPYYLYNFQVDYLTED